MYQATLHHWLILGCTVPASALFQRALYSCSVVLVEGNYRGQSCVHLSVLLVVPLPETQIWNRIWASLFKNKICSCFLRLTLSHPLLLLTYRLPHKPSRVEQTQQTGFFFTCWLWKKLFCVCLWKNVCWLWLEKHPHKCKYAHFEHAWTHTCTSVSVHECV